MFYYLAADEIALINEVVIQESGGLQGLREPGMLESIAFKPQTNLSGEDLYPDLYLKAAVIYESLVNYRIFIDGNKRTGFVAMVRFLHINGYRLIVSDEEIVSYSVAIATKKPDLADIAIWIKTRSKKIKK